MAERFRLVQDDSAHWYAIPADITSLSQFESWVAASEDDTEDYSGPSFDKYRLGMYLCNYSFTDLQEDRT